MIYKIYIRKLVLKKDWKEVQNEKNTVTQPGAQKEHVSLNA